MQQMWDDLLAPHQRPGVPQILCGDLNTNRYNPAVYRPMLETLQAEDGPLPTGSYPYTADSQTNAWQGRGHHFQKVIDYVLLRPQGRTLHISRQVLAPQAPLSPKRNAKRIKPIFDLSDHYAVAARIVFR
jgi:endonuclease/exonuclease/phosphatase family metal-dependent hydrolase